MDSAVGEERYDSEDSNSERGSSSSSSGVSTSSVSLLTEYTDGFMDWPSSSKNKQDVRSRRRQSKNDDDEEEEDDDKTSTSTRTRKQKLKGGNSTNENGDDDAQRNKNGEKKQARMKTKTAGSGGGGDGSSSNSERRSLHRGELNDGADDNTPHNRNRGDDDDNDDVMDDNDDDLSMDGSSQEDGNGHDDDNSEDYYSEDSDGSSIDSTSWSLSVRLNSVVDLPPGILPSVPLCPHLKFGLITLHNDDELQELEMSSAISRRQEYEQSKDEKTVLPQTSLRISSGILADFQRSMSLVECSKQSSSSSSESPDGVGVKCSKSNARNSLDSSRLSTSSSTLLSIKHSSGKVMSKRDSGMMEWHEEMRWDNISLPLQTVLAIELSTRAVLPPSGSQMPRPLSINSMAGSDLDAASWASSNTTSTYARKNMDYDDRYEKAMQTANGAMYSASKGIGDTSTNMNKNSGMQNNERNRDGPGRGLLGLWRRGRQTIERRRKNRSILDGNQALMDSDVSSVTSSFAQTSFGSVSPKMERKELEVANKAASLARRIIEGENALDSMDSQDGEKNENQGQADGDLRLGTLLIPISNLPLEDEIPRVEKWYQFDTDGSGDKKNSAPWQTPSVLLDITLCTPRTLDAIEDEVYAALAVGDEDDKHPRSSQGGDAGGEAHGEIEIRDGSNGSHTRGGAQQRRKRAKSISEDESMSSQEKKEAMEKKRAEEEERIAMNGPYLEPGIVDHICVIGAKDIGNGKNDNGQKGWVESEPESCVLEQFPPDEFHKNNGRNCTLPHKIEWWCFPEGYKIWRGSEPPTHMDMNLKRFSASSPPRMASSIAAFDACLNCTTSFMWWVMSSNSDEYGSSISKTYGAVIRFYAPIPPKEESKVDENLDNESETKLSGGDKVWGEMDATSDQLWCPLGICLTSSLPIVGILEALLLRLCEKLASSSGANSIGFVKPIIHADILNLIVNYQRPIPGVINCSIPFLSNEADRLLVSIPPIDSLPPLPHGASVTSVCRLLGAEGLTALLAAVLTECKILIHSADVANLAMVGEVITALMYPFQWQLPYIPVLPLSMIEVVEAPVSYFIGIPTCNMKWIDKAMLPDVVVIDLDNGFSSPDYFDIRSNAESNSAPNPLPASVSSNISKAIFRLLREEEEVQAQYGSSNFSDTRHLPRLEVESLAEREFRVAVAHQICGLIRGYQECLFFVSASQPVFNRDRFLRQAPALFEERRGKMSSSTTSLSSISISSSNNRMLSPRSKRFLSGLVNSQHFHALLEKLDSEAYSFFHDVMETFQKHDEEGGAMYSYGSSRQRAILNQLKENLEEFEQQIPTYHVHRHHLVPLKEDEDDNTFDFIGGYFSSFTSNLLQTSSSLGTIKKRSPEAGKLSLQELVELEKLPWLYCRLFNINLKPNENTGPSVLWKKIHLKEALGERRFKAWKRAQEPSEDDGGMEVETGVSKINKSASRLFKASRRHVRSAIDLTKLISNARSDEIALEEKNMNFVTKLKRGVLADRDVIKRYIERAYEIVEKQQDDTNIDDVSSLFNDISSEVDTAMKNPSAQRFLISVLSQRSRLQNEHRRMDNNATLQPGYNIEVSTARLHPLVFKCLFRLCNSMLEACYRDGDYQAAYRLLIHTTGFCTTSTDDENMEVSYMTKLIAKHQIYGDLRLWDRVLLVHQQDRQRDKNVLDSVEKKSVASDNENDNYEAAVSTLYEMLGYGMPADDLARFASRVASEKFYSTDREHKLLMLARRLAVKCEEGAPDDDLISYDSDLHSGPIGDGSVKSSQHSEQSSGRWLEVAWSHTSGSNINENYSSRNSPITAMASFRSSVVVTGALDGSIFLARVSSADQNNMSDKGGAQHNHQVKGTRLEWQFGKSSNLNNPQEDFSHGAISCLAAIVGFNHKELSHFDSSGFSGCRLVGGTTGGKIALWSVGEILSDMRDDELLEGAFLDSPDVSTHSAQNLQSSHIRSMSSARLKKRTRARKGRILGEHRGGVTCTSTPPQIYRPDSLISGGNDGLIKLWSLRKDQSDHNRRRASMGGRTSRILFSSGEKTGRDTLDVLAGHGGRILCVETAWHGDRLLSGAADRTVKLWDLASQSGGRCLQTMHGHTGWVTHGRYWGRNTIISASSDRSIALWDTRTSGSSPLFVLRWHNGPVSDLYLESRNASWMTSAGADGSVATWDFRMMMRNYTKEDGLTSVGNGVGGSGVGHNVNGSHPLKKSNSSHVLASTATNNTASTTIFRQPNSHMSHTVDNCGPVLLSKGVGTRYGQGERSIMSVSVDNIVKEWDIVNGSLLNEYKVHHNDKISCFKTVHAMDSRQGQDHDTPVKSVSDNSGGSNNADPHNAISLGGYITGSWDGTVRFRQLYLESKS